MTRCLPLDACNQIDSRFLKTTGHPNVKGAMHYIALANANAKIPNLLLVLQGRTYKRIRTVRPTPMNIAEKTNTKLEHFSKGKACAKLRAEEVKEPIICAMCL